MKKTEWFQRNFPPIEDNGLLPGILERLEGTPARLKHKLNQLTANLSAHTDGKWSILKEIGHLIDLEPLWRHRMEQIVAGEKNLIAADLSNRKTHETDYDSAAADLLIEQFEQARRDTMLLLRALREEDLEKAAVHPRLGTPMRLIDLAYFVAEHDDHHLAQVTTLSQGI